MYIRPICLIQVERTGRDQRRPGVVHADDVRDYLIRHPGILAEHVAVKTSQRDELKEVDEAGGLLSRECPIRFIVTDEWEQWLNAMLAAQAPRGTSST